MHSLEGSTRAICGCFWPHTTQCGSGRHQPVYHLAILPVQSLHHNTTDQPTNQRPTASVALCVLYAQQRTVQMMKMIIIIQRTTGCPQKKTTTFSTAPSNQPQLNALILAQRFKRQLCVCLPPHLHNAHTCMSVYHLTCVMPIPGIYHLTCVMPIPGIMLQTSYILAIHKTVKQWNLNSKILSINLTQWIMNHKNTIKCAQNVHREPWHKQKDGDATDWWLQRQLNGPDFSIRLTVSVSVLQDVIKIKRLK